MIKAGGAPISPRSDLLTYVRPQGEGAPPSGVARTKNQISNLAFFILVPKFYSFSIKPSEFVN